MMNRRRIRRERLTGHRRGQTLIELLVSMAMATVLMLGLGSSLFIASSAFDGTPVAMRSSQAAGVQADMMVDLNEARFFLSRNADSVTFTVPDRNADGLDETLTYAWTGLPTGELTYAANGTPPVTILDNVEAFQLTYGERLLLGRSTTQPPLDPSSWGYRWQTLFNFGNETVYPDPLDISGQHIGTRVTLNEAGTLKSISVYMELVNPSKKGKVLLGIYDADVTGLPRNLLASTAASDVTQTGWLTATTPDTVLSPGDYYLALCVQDTGIAAPRRELGVGLTHTKNRDAIRHGFVSSWGTSNGIYTMRVSIYGTYER